MDDKLREEVLNILDMFVCLTTSYRKLKDTTGIKEAEISFLGFDGNNELSHLLAARTILKESPKYQVLVDESLKAEHLNSHWHVLEAYRRKLDHWNSLGKTDEVSKTELISIQSMV